MSDGSQAEADRYGRLLRYVDLADHRDLSQILLELGWARVYAPAGQLERQETYAAAETSARAKQAGMWTRCR